MYSFQLRVKFFTKYLAEFVRVKFFMRYLAELVRVKFFMRYLAELIRVKIFMRYLAELIRVKFFMRYLAYVLYNLITVSKDKSISGLKEMKREKQPYNSHWVTWV